MLVLAPDDLFDAVSGRLLAWRVTLHDGAVSRPDTLRLAVRTVVQADRDSMLAYYTSRVDAATARTLQERMRFPAHYPAFSRAVMGRDTTIWLRGFHTDSIAWTVFSRDLRPRARVTFEHGVAPMAISMRHVWARRTTSDGLPIIIRYRMVRRRDAVRMQVDAAGATTASHRPRTHP